jgi:hypothetical protein
MGRLNPLLGALVPRFFNYVRNQNHMIFRSDAIGFGDGMF